MGACRQDLGYYQVPRLSRIYANGLCPSQWFSKTYEGAVCRGSWQSRTCHRANSQVAKWAWRRHYTLANRLWCDGRRGGSPYLDALYREGLTPLPVVGFWPSNTQLSTQQKEHPSEEKHYVYHVWRGDIKNGPLTSKTVRIRGWASGNSERYGYAKTTFIHLNTKKFRIR